MFNPVGLAMPISGLLDNAVRSTWVRCQILLTAHLESSNRLNPRAVPFQPVMPAEQFFVSRQQGLGPGSGEAVNKHFEREYAVSGNVVKAACNTTN